MADEKVDERAPALGTEGLGRQGEGAVPIQWMSTTDAAERLGVTLRTLYRFIDSGDLAAFKFGRVIRLRSADVEGFIEASRIAPGSLDHLYPETKGRTTATSGSQS
jgi:excisionase family DNA binding protein